MRRFSSLRTASVATLFAAAALATTANASPVNVNLVGSPAAIAGGLFAFTYQVDLAETERFETGQFFTIDDFAGFTGTPTFTGLTGASAFSVVYGAGGNPDGLPLTTADQAGINNLIFTYTGAANQNADFTVTVNSIFGGTAVDSYVARTTDLGTGEAGPVFSSGGVRVAAQVIPEPGTMALAATGLLPLAGAVIRRRRSTK